MNRFVFVDTSGWTALKNKNDNFCEISTEIKRKLLLSGHRFITTDYVLDETYTLLRIRANHKLALEFGEEIQKSSLIDIFRIDSGLLRDAWKIFKQYKDKEFSFTDCTSFAVMKKMKINFSLTTDHHFEQAGYQILLKES